MIFYHTNGFFSPWSLKVRTFVICEPRHQKERSDEQATSVISVTASPCSHLPRTGGNVFLDYMSNTDVKVRQDIFS